ncbi:MAG TPA: hypothetical protein VIY52_29565 [Streptosporangiaceae bacterium]
MDPLDVVGWGAGAELGGGAGAGAELGGASVGDDPPPDPPDEPPPPDEPVEPDEPEDVPELEEPDERAAAWPGCAFGWAPPDAPARAAEWRLL